MDIEAWACLGSELIMSVNSGVRELLMELAEQMEQRLRLLRCACVRRLAMVVKTSCKSNTD